MNVRRAFSLPLLALALLACGGAPPPSAPPATADTLAAHARAGDGEGLRRAVAAIRSGAVAERTTGLAALLEYEPLALQPLLSAVSARALHGETAGERAEAAWVLVHAGDVRVAEAALASYDAGALEKVARLDGSRAFDAVAFARLLATAAVPASASASRRRAIAAALPTADAATRPLLVRALAGDADDAGPLVVAAEALDPKKDFIAIEDALRRVRALADPRAKDALARYADHARSPYFRTEAALLLAELGDLRAAPHLAWRITQSASKLYHRSDPRLAPLARDDRERVACAWLLGDLALAHPEARAQLREAAEAPVTAWLRARSSPHPSGERFLAVSGSPNAPAFLAAIADPKRPIPPPGSPPPLPDEFPKAQAALRWLGATRDASALPVLRKQLGRKPAGFDATLDALARDGDRNAVTGMAVRALQTGAVDGLSELGDPKGLPALLEVAADAKQNEDVRLRACAAAAWLADARARAAIVARLRRTGADRKRAFETRCWLQGLAGRPSAADAPELVALLAPKVPRDVRHEAARLIGLGGLDPATRDKLVGLLGDDRVVHDAALALLFGGDDASVAKVLARYAPPAPGTPPPTAPLRQLYARSVPSLGEGVYESGALARMVSLARAARSAHEGWLLQGLAYQLRQGGAVDEGPHSLTRARLRARLLADADGADPKKRDQALLVLWILGERASLEALGPVAKPTRAEPSP